MPIDVRLRHAPAWDAALKPVGEGSFGKEPFAAWWARNGGRLPDLHPLAAEQWVFRHWRHSPFCHLPLERLTCGLEQWTTERFLREVATGWPEAPLQPETNHRMFHGKFFEPSRTMDATGTWNIPPVVLASPHGFLTNQGDQPDLRFWLVEGHQRRCPRALAHRGEAAAEREVFMPSLGPP